MLAIKIATLMKHNADEIAATWARRAADLIGAGRSQAMDGDAHKHSHRAVELCAEFLKNELKTDDLRRWAADAGHHAHDAKLRPDQMLGYFICGRTAVRDFILNEETIASAMDQHQVSQLIQRNAAFFDQTALFAIGVLDAESKGHAHPTDAPHLFK